ncbi:hypothetical protein FNF27_07797 [Cafeteria roenbergensis]|uniref:Uncharacterized protein n=2 Tax=Cafeteria roenbergensis TaxID=33653 RepID=A0A5A8DKM7_CAFRO|nr:hypothetical protein FNF27_07797 [Cafeteria roenbergensis]
MVRLRSASVATLAGLAAALLLVAANGAELARGAAAAATATEWVFKVLAVDEFDVAAGDSGAPGLSVAVVRVRLLMPSSGDEVSLAGSIGRVVLRARGQAKPLPMVGTICSATLSPWGGDGEADDHGLVRAVLEQSAWTARAAAPTSVPGAKDSDRRLSSLDLVFVPQGGAAGIRDVSDDAAVLSALEARAPTPPPAVEGPDVTFEGHADELGDRTGLQRLGRLCVELAAGSRESFAQFPGAPAAAMADRMREADEIRARKLDAMDAMDHGAGSKARPSSEFAQSLRFVGRVAAQNVWAMATLGGAMLVMVTRFTIGDWFSLQLRLLASLVVSPLSDAQLSDSTFVIGQILAAIFVSILTSCTIGSTEWWGGVVKSASFLEPWQRLAIRLVMLARVRSTALIMLIKALVMLWSWSFRPPLHDPGAVPVLPLSAAGLSFQSMAAAAAARWEPAAHPLAGRAADGTAETLSSGYHIEEGLRASGWVLFNEAARGSFSLNTTLSAALGLVREDCPSCDLTSDAARSKQSLVELSRHAASVARDTQFRAPGVGVRGLGVVLDSSCLTSDYSGLARPPPTVGGGSPCLGVPSSSAPLDPEHVWAPFPVLTSPRQPRVQAAGWIPDHVRRAADSGLALLLHASVTLFCMLVELGVVRISPLRGSLGRWASYATVVSAQALALGVLRSFARLNRAGISFPVALLGLLRAAPLPLLGMGLVNILVGAVTSLFIKEHFGWGATQVVMVVVVNLLLSLWTARAGEALAEALATDLAAGEHMGFAGGVVAVSASLQGPVAADPGMIRGAAELSAWASAHEPIPPFVEAMAAGAPFAPTFDTMALTVRLLVLAFAGWVGLVWVHVGTFVARASSVFNLVFTDAKLKGRPELGESPQLLRVLIAIVSDMTDATRSWAVEDSHLAHEQEEAGGAHWEAVADTMQLGSAPAAAGMGRAAAAGGHGDSAPHDAFPAVPAHPPGGVAASVAAAAAAGRRTTSRTGTGRGDGLAGQPDSPYPRQPMSTERLFSTAAMSLLGVLSGVERLCSHTERLVARQAIDFVAANLGPTAVDTGRISIRVSVTPSVAQLEQAATKAVKLSGLPGHVLGAVWASLPGIAPPSMPLVTLSFNGIRLPSAQDCIAVTNAERAAASLPPLPEDSGPPLRQFRSQVSAEVGLQAVGEQLRHVLAAGLSGNSLSRVDVTLIVDPPPLTGEEGRLLSLAGVATMAAGALVPERAEFQLLSWEDGQFSGILAKHHEPITLSRHAKKLEAIEGVITDRIHSLQEMEHTAAASRAAGVLAQRLASVREAVHMLRADVVAARGGGSSAAEMVGHLRLRIVEAIFLAASVHRAEMGVSEHRSASAVAVSQLATALTELFADTVIASQLRDSSPIVTVAVSVLMLAMQYRFFPMSRANIDAAVSAALGVTAAAPQGPDGAGLPAKREACLLWRAKRQLAVPSPRRLPPRA